MDLSGHALVALMAELRGADLSGLCLAGIDLNGRDLSGANLSGADLSRANLSRCDLSQAELSHAILQRASFDEADLSGACLTGARLENANLAGTTMEGAILKGANLRGAQLIHADLTAADLSSADIRGADLEGANFADAKLDGLQSDPGQLLKTAELEWFVRCPVCARQGVLTQVRYEEEDGGLYTIPVWPWFSANDLAPYKSANGGTTMADYWPCGHLSNEAHELLYGNWCTLEDDDWLDFVAEDLVTRFGVDSETAKRLSEIGGWEALECLQQHFELIRIDTGDMWGSEYVLPFAEDPAEALRQGWDDLLRLIREEGSEKDIEQCS